MTIDDAVARERALRARIHIAVSAWTYDLPQTVININDRVAQFAPGIVRDEPLVPPDNHTAPHAAYT